MFTDDQLCVKVCPRCDSKNIVVHSPEIKSDGTVVTVVFCEECGFSVIHSVAHEEDMDLESLILDAVEMWENSSGFGLWGQTIAHVI